MLHPERELLCFLHARCLRCSPTSSRAPRYESAVQQFTNLDKVIHYVNAQKGDQLNLMCVGPVASRVWRASECLNV